MRDRFNRQLKLHAIPILWAIVVCTAQHITGLDRLLRHIPAPAAAAAEQN
jgi:hypothetical protein